MFTPLVLLVPVVLCVALVLHGRSTRRARRGELASTVAGHGGSIATEAVLPPIVRACALLRHDLRYADTGPVACQPASVGFVPQRRVVLFDFAPLRRRRGRRRASFGLLQPTKQAWPHLLVLEDALRIHAVDEARDLAEIPLLPGANPRFRYYTDDPAAATVVTPELVDWFLRRVPPLTGVELRDGHLLLVQTAHDGLGASPDGQLEELLALAAELTDVVSGPRYEDATTAELL